MMTITTSGFTHLYFIINDSENENGFVCHLENVEIPLFIFLHTHMLPPSNANIPETLRLCIVYIIAS